METKSTNEVKGDYDRVSASECLGSLIELHGIVMEDDLFVIPDADGTAVLYNDGKIRFDEIADIEVGSVEPKLVLPSRLAFAEELLLALTFSCNTMVSVSPILRGRRSSNSG